MNVIQYLKNTWGSIPNEVQTFLKRALFIFIIWKLIYHLFLFQGRIIDAPLTHFSGAGAEWLLQRFYPQSMLTIQEVCNPIPELNNEIGCMDYVSLNGKKIVGIADGCNALELYILYVGFLIAFSGPIKKIIIFSVAGIVIIYAVNISRLAALAVMNMYHFNAANIAHHYIFKVVVYAVIFGIWVIYVKQKMQHE